MNKSIHLHFDCGGHYVKKGDGYEWNSKEDKMYPLLFKRVCVDDITYSMLLNGVCKKVGINSGNTSVRLSFIPVDATPPRQSYICDDDDVFVYLTSKDNNKLSVLHVEVEEMENVVEALKKKQKVVVSGGDQQSGIYQKETLDILDKSILVKDEDGGSEKWCFPGKNPDVDTTESAEGPVVLKTEKENLKE